MLGQTGWKCRACDHINTRDSWICENCGENNELQMNSQTNNICPVCGQSDTIQRLSAVVLGGKFYLPQIDGVGLGTSELARLLAPPPPPNRSAGLSVTTWVGLGIFFGLWPILFLVTDYLYTNFAQEYAEGLFPINIYFESLLRIAIPASFVVFILAIGAMLLYHFITRKKAAKYFEVHKPIWEQAIFHWNLTYYCHRDGVVFAAETDRVCAAQDIYSFLYSDW